MFPICCMHADTISVLFKEKCGSLAENNLQVDLKKLKIGNYILQAFAMFIYLKQEDPYGYLLKMLDYFDKELEGNKDKIGLIKNYNDIITNINNNKLSALLTVEEGGMIDSLDKLIYLYNRGVRLITLTWNFDNVIGSCNKTTNDIGLSQYGLQFIKKMEELGIIIDVSHLSDKGFWDVYNNTKKPFVASHSNSRKVTDHKRNLTDEMIKAIASRNGVIGLNFCPSFVSDKDFMYIDDIIKHALHIIEVGGIDVLAFGTDFDGIPPKTEVKDASEMQIFYHRFKECGLTDIEIEKIFYKNTLRVINEVLGEKS